MDGFEKFKELYRFYVRVRVNIWCLVWMVELIVRRNRLGMEGMGGDEEVIIFF